jgi:hypothetical protein
VAHWTAEVADYLETLALGVVGTTLFYGQLPPSPSECGAVIPAPGFPSDAIMGQAGVGIERPRGQIVFRGTKDDVATPLTKAQIAFEALQQQALTIGSTLFLTLRPLQSPFLRGYSPAGLPEICFNIEAEIQR